MPSPTPSLHHKYHQRKQTHTLTFQLLSVKVLTGVEDDDGDADAGIPSPSPNSDNSFQVVLQRGGVLSQTNNLRYREGVNSRSKSYFYKPNSSSSSSKSAATSSSSSSSLLCLPLSFNTNGKTKSKIYNIRLLVDNSAEIAQFTIDASDFLSPVGEVSKEVEFSSCSSKCGVSTDVTLTGFVSCNSFSFGIADVTDVDIKENQNGKGNENVQNTPVRNNPKTSINKYSPFVGKELGNISSSPTNNRDLPFIAPNLRQELHPPDPTSDSDEDGDDGYHSEASSTCHPSATYSSMNSSIRLLEARVLQLEEQNNTLVESLNMRDADNLDIDEKGDKLVNVIEKLVGKKSGFIIEEEKNTHKLRSFYTFDSIEMLVRASINSHRLHQSLLSKTSSKLSSKLHLQTTKLEDREKEVIEKDKEVSDLAKREIHVNEHKHLAASRLSRVFGEITQSLRHHKEFEKEVGVIPIQEEEGEVENYIISADNAVDNHNLPLPSPMKGGSVVNSSRLQTENTHLKDLATTLKLASNKLSVKVDEKNIQISNLNDMIKGNSQVIENQGGLLTDLNTTVTILEGALSDSEEKTVLLEQQSITNANNFEVDKKNIVDKYEAGKKSLIQDHDEKIKKLGLSHQCELEDNDLEWNDKLTEVNESLNHVTEELVDKKMEIAQLFLSADQTRLELRNLNRNR